MSALLPLLFMVLAASALLLAILSFWQSLRGAFGATDPLASFSHGGSALRHALEDEKAGLMRSLQDLKFEWQIGKLSDEDYRAQEAAIRARTREVMRLLDADVEPFRAEAEDLVQGSLSSRSASIASPYRGRGRAASEAPQDCPSCATPNDPDAEFCKKCGVNILSSMDGGETSESESTAGSSEPETGSTDESDEPSDEKEPTS